MVDFQGGNAELPYVIGNMFNTNAKSGFHKGDNSIKAIRTRSGNSIVLDDAGGSITITDHSGNVIKMDGSQNISITAPKKITIKAGEEIELNSKVINILASNEYRITGEDGPTNSGTILAKTSLLIGSVTELVVGAGGNIDISSPNNHIGGITKMDGGDVFIN